MNRLFSFDPGEIAIVSLIAFSLFSVSIMNLSNDAYAHSALNSGAKIKTIDNKYQIAFEMYPKFASAGQDTTLHFSYLDGNKSNLVSIYTGLVIKEKVTGRIVDQMPYRFYEFGDISIPYKFHNNSDYVATLLTRINGDSKYFTTPLQADFDIPVGQTTIISPNELLIAVIPFTLALVGGIIFLFKQKKWKYPLQYSAKAG